MISDRNTRLMAFIHDLRHKLKIYVTALYCNLSGFLFPGSCDNHFHNLWLYDFYFTFTIFCISPNRFYFRQPQYIALISFLRNTKSITHKAFMPLVRELLTNVYFFTIRYPFCAYTRTLQFLKKKTNFSK